MTYQNPELRGTSLRKGGGTRRMRSETCLAMICLPLHHTETDGLRALFRLRGFFGPSSHELAGGDFWVVLNHSKNFFELKIPPGKDFLRLRVHYTYEIEWKRVSTPWVNRWDVYLLGVPDDSVARHSSFVNSVSLIVLLSALNEWGNYKDHKVPHWDSRLQWESRYIGNHV